MDGERLRATLTEAVRESERRGYATVVVARDDLATLLAAPAVTETVERLGGGPAMDADLWRDLDTASRTPGPTMTITKAQYLAMRERLAALDFIADWAHDCIDGDTKYGFDAIERMARAALAAPAVTETADLRAAVARMRYHPDLRGKSAEYVAGWDAATRAMAEEEASDGRP